MATAPYWLNNARTVSTLFSGSRLARTSVTPTWLAMVCAAAALSPVSMTSACTPARLSASSAARLVSRTVSATAM